MAEIYIFIVVLLFILAISDLVVGVSNDAVNFLNSAIGSRVAPWRTIMITASAGILCGAMFSSGLMEVARKGIFNPDVFVFSEVMVIFLAVMITDIILLDAFNTLGMPTSTTVSIVFELLGAAVAVAAWKVMANGEGLGNLPTYINSDKALAIIAGIFISVGMAFTVGALVMYISRLLFSFNYEKRIKWAGPSFGGLAMTGITDFLLLKGLKGASFITDSFLAFTEENHFLILGGAFIFWTILMWVLQNVGKVNILRVIVLVGTFSLAMAFAGNDLVNFVGVPLAGFESFNTWRDSGVSDDSFLMTSLAQPYKAKTYMLLIAGVVMTLTLWLSKKARTVTETEVNLGRQSEGLERFSSNTLSRVIVRGVYGLSKNTSSLISKDFLDRIDSNFEPKEQKQPDPPAFDLVRAAVNLTMASILIALATSYKLPLSTTYVSFMVAMGTSLADRAWGRDSAVFRVSGVLNVIGGWFITAFVAFTVAGLFASLMYHFELPAIIGLVLLAVFFISRTFIVHQRREKKKERLAATQRQANIIPAQEMITNTSKSVQRSLEAVANGYRDSINGLLEEDRRQLSRIDSSMNQLAESNEEFKFTFYGSIKRIQEEYAEGSKAYLLAYDLEQDLVQSANTIADACRSHVEDVLLPLKPEQSEEMRRIADRVEAFINMCANMLETQDYSEFRSLNDEKKDLLTAIENLLADQSAGIKDAKYGARNSFLFFSILLETKDLVAVSVRFIKLYRRLHYYDPSDPWVLVSKQGG